MPEQKTITNLRLKLKPLEIGSILEGIVISKKRGELYVDLSPYGTGRLYGSFYLQSKNLAQKLNPGDIIGVKIVGLDDGHGNYEILLQELSALDKWQKILNHYQKGEILELEIKDANRGGWLVELEGIQGFIPVSQLSPEYYPRVDTNNKNLIYEHLKKFVGQKIKCKIFSADPKTNKLVLSEKAAKEGIHREIISKLMVGDIMPVTVVGLSSFGIFVRFNENPPMDGLIHISEIPEEKIDLEKNFKVGDRFMAKLIQIKQDKVSFSLKNLEPDPWVVFTKKYQEGNEVSGILKEKNEIFGIVDIDGVQGLVFENLDKMEIGQRYNFIIDKFQPKEKNLILKLIDADSAD
jgi:small subunit ribosomal protein S1